MIRCIVKRGRIHWVVCDCFCYETPAEAMAVLEDFLQAVARGELR